MLDDAGLADIGGTEQVQDGDGAGDVGKGEGVGRGLGEQAGGTEGLAEDFMRAADVEAFLGEDADDGFEQPVIPGEGGATDAGEEFGAFGVGAEVEQGGAADRADHHQIAAVMGAELAEDAAGGAEADDGVWVGGEHGGVGKAFEPDDEHRAAGRLRGGGDAGGQDAAARENAERVSQRRRRPRSRWCGSGRACLGCR